jgi:O-antigen ligase
VRAIDRSPAGPLLPRAVTAHSLAGRFGSVYLVGAFALCNIFFGYEIARGHGRLVILASLVPLLVLLSAELVVRHRTVLVFAALLIAMIGGPINGRLPGTGGTALYLADIIVVLALASWFLARLVLPDESKPLWPRSLVFSWPFYLFAGAVMLGIVRGHLRYGTNYLALPMRMILYAGIAGAIAGLSTRSAYRGIVWVFYVGAVWQAGAALYYLARGTSQTSSVNLSTSGTRTLALSTAMYLAGALVLALLNLDREKTWSRRLGHLVIAGLASFGIIVAFGRTTFAAIGVIVPILFVALRRVRWVVFTHVPLFIPILALAVIVAVKVQPTLWPTLEARLSGNVTTDPSLIGRERQAHAALQGIGKERFLGLGFGRTVHYTAIDRSDRTFSGDPQNSYVYLLAGGGALALGSFIVLVLAFYRDSLRRLRNTTHEGRVVVAFSMALAFVFFVNASTGPVLSVAPFVLTIWIAMLLPTVVARPETDVSKAASVRAPVLPSKL